MKLRTRHLLILTWLVSFQLQAAYMLHDWTIGEWPNEIGLQGMSGQLGRDFYTKICLGSLEHSFYLPVHIYVVIAVLALPVPISLLLFSAKNRRNRQPTQP